MEKTMKYINKWSLYKLNDLLCILICLSFIIIGLYAYFILKKGDIQTLIFGILFFSAGIAIELISLTSKHKGWFISKEQSTRKQNIIFSICGFIFATGSLWIAITGNLHIILRLSLVGGFLFFGVGSIVLLIRK